MSNKSGTSSQIISLPKGGGALQGIGEKFSPDLFTGTGNFTLPIALPPGRNSFQPELNLIYSTGNGNGPFGLGWSLNIPGVSRKTSKGVPVYDDAKDTFILSGAEDLVPVEESVEENQAQTTHCTRYRPRTEGLFARIRHYRTINKREKTIESDYWKVESKEGLVSFYGTEDKPDNASQDWQDPAVITDPEKEDKIFAWKLTETQDPFRNRIAYEYERDTDSDEPRHWDQLYLKRIQYVDYTDNDGKEKFLVSVTFNYEDRPDPFSEYRPGFEIRTRSRCKSIEIRTDADKERRVRTYELIYLDELEGLENRLPLNGVSLLSQVKVVGHDDEQPDVDKQTEELPPLEFGYTRFEPEERDFFPLKGYLPSRSLASPDLELADLFENGLPDIIEMNGTVRYWRNLGNGTFDLPREMRDAPVELNLADPGVQLIDANGDGRIDLLVTIQGFAGYYPLRFGGMWDRRSFQRYEFAPSFNLEDPEVRLVDLDGDGVTDAIRSGTCLECFFNDPEEGWNGTRSVERRRLEEFPNINFSDPRVKWGDMSGDGLQDIVLVHDGNVEYWPNLGNGNWSRRISMRNSPRFPYGYDPKRILVGDVDGDGLADIVYVDDTKVTLWINQCGNSWSDPIEIQGTPPISDMDAVRLADMLGTGIGGVLWSKDATVLSRENYYFLNPTGGVKPYLLNRMDNHMGAVTRVDYASSTGFYLEDQKRPGTRWKTPLSFPVQVVSGVEVIDQISRGKLTTEYTYHHGYWDGAEGEFRGFGRVDKRDTEIFERYHEGGSHWENSFDSVERDMFSPPLETRTWFHQGPIGDEFGEWEEPDVSNEFWNQDLPLLTRPLEMVNFLKNLPRRTRRDALRALRSRILRTELYALDGTERQGRPYTVTESLHVVREEASPFLGREHAIPVFFPHTLAQRTTEWERGDDPMTQITLMDSYDAYGQSCQQTLVALPRRKAKRLPITGAGVGLIEGDEVNQTRILSTHTCLQYATPDEDLYIHDRVAQELTFELRSPPVLNETAPDNLALVLQEQVATAKGVHKKYEALSPDEVHIIGHKLNRYDGEAFVGRQTGKLGPYGALVRSEALAFTDEELDAAYRGRRPNYLGGSATLPESAPSNFGADLGLRSEQSSKGVYYDGYYMDTECRKFDFQAENSLQNRGLITAMRDSLGHETTIQQDKYGLLPHQVEDPIGLNTNIQYDYRVMQPLQATYPNGNASHFRYTPLGLVHKQFLVGGDGEGGSEEMPESTFTYDFGNYISTRQELTPQPVSVHTIQRIYHARDRGGVSNDGTAHTIESWEYSDGFGRLIQTRIQAEDVIFGEVGEDVGLPPEASEETMPAVGRHVGDSVVVSGWRVYDNKAQVIKQYEPFFATGSGYQPERETERCHVTTIHYDPRGRAVQTVNPDGSQQRVVFGIAPDLREPNYFLPTPWESSTYDANDLAPVSLKAKENGSWETLADGAPEKHHFTPSSALVDSLGRVICQLERNGPQPTKDWFVTRFTYDLRGNLLIAIDALGRDAFRYYYDLLNHTIRIESIDGGIRTSVLDAVGNPVEYRDSNGSLVLRQYDNLNRPTHLWARNHLDADLTLRERLIYGDNRELSGIDRAIAGQKYLLGRLFKYYDEAGLQCFDRYDFKGNLEEKTRRVVRDEEIANSWIADWSRPHCEEVLDSRAYRTSTRYDALNRPIEVVYPSDVNDNRSVARFYYNRAGGLTKVELDNEPYITHISYNSKGQRVLIAFGNGVMTRYVYDQKTFRLLRMRSEHYMEPDDLIYTPTGKIFQDFSYAYDLAGNIATLYDRTPESGLSANPDRLDRIFTYDPLYRLLSASGREHDWPVYQRPPWAEITPTQDPTKKREYLREFEYDPAGNLQRIKHTSNPSSFIRTFALMPGKNRLATLTIGRTTYSYLYDNNGNLIQENTERHYIWDHANRLVAFRNQPKRSHHASVEVRYLYDAEGMRVKKWVRRSGGNDCESTVYIDGMFEHHRWQQDGENNCLHVMNDQQRIALVRRGLIHPNDSGPRTQYHLGDHLDSSNVVIDDKGDWTNREEYFPFGETSFGSFAKKRFRFAGKERDEENGLNYHGARYYAPWLGRWVSTDPAGAADGNNPYCYTNKNPIGFVDLYGTQTSESKAKEIGNISSGPEKNIQSKESAAEYLKRLENRLQSRIFLEMEEEIKTSIGEVRQGRKKEWTLEMKYIDLLQETYSFYKSLEAWKDVNRDFQQGVKRGVSHYFGEKWQYVNNMFRVYRFGYRSKPKQAGGLDEEGKPKVSKDYSRLHSEEAASCVMTHEQSHSEDFTLWFGIVQGVKTPFYFYFYGLEKVHNERSRELVKSEIKAHTRHVECLRNKMGMVWKALLFREYLIDQFYKVKAGTQKR